MSKDWIVLCRLLQNTCNKCSQCAKNQLSVDVIDANICR